MGSYGALGAGRQSKRPRPAAGGVERHRRTYRRLKNADLPGNSAMSPASSQSPLRSGHPGVGVPRCAPLLLLSPRDPLRWALAGALGAGRQSKRPRPAAGGVERHRRTYRRLKNADLPGNSAMSPSSSSMRSSWLYLATRSVRLGAPVLIWPAFRATAMSAMVASSVSPER